MITDYRKNYNCVMCIYALCTLYNSKSRRDGNKIFTLFVKQYKMIWR